MRRDLALGHGEVDRLQGLLVAVEEVELLAPDLDGVHGIRLGDARPWQLRWSLDAGWEDMARLISLGRARRG